MANITKSAGFVSKLEKDIVNELKAIGIKAKVTSEPVPTTKLFRLMVLSPQFKEMYHSERQSLVWRITEKAISQADQNRISMILTLTADEAKGK
ncbi:MAG: hypothetical protein EHM48_01415 [Planctomycetaceae bacterium]|nr:MAG: hypothetical protein EHM48_01415 [Planctomycetaceae bacterium]